MGPSVVPAQRDIHAKLAQLRARITTNINSIQGLHAESDVLGSDVTGINDFKARLGKLRAKQEAGACTTGDMGARQAITQTPASTSAVAVAEDKPEETMLTPLDSAFGDVRPDADAGAHARVVALRSREREGEESKDDGTSLQPKRGNHASESGAVRGESVAVRGESDRVQSLSVSLEAARAELRELRAKERGRRKEEATLRAALNSATAKEEMAMLRIQRLESDLGSIRAHAANRDAAGSERQAELEGVKERLEGELRGLQVQLGHSKDQVAALRSQHSAAMAEQARVSRDLEALRAALQEARGEMTKREDEAESRLEEKRTEAAALELQRQAVEAELEGVRAEWDAERATQAQRARDLEDRSRILQERIALLESEKTEELQKRDLRISELNAIVERLQSEMEAHQSQLTAALAESETLRKDQEALSESLRAQVRELELEVERLKAMLADKEAEAKETQENLTVEKEYLSKHLEEQLASVRSELVERQEEVRDLKSRAEVAARDREAAALAAEEESRGLRERMEETEGHLREAREQIEALETSKVELEKRLEEQIHDLTEELKKLALSREEERKTSQLVLEEERGSAAARVSSLEEQLQTLRSQIEDANSQLEQMVSLQQSLELSEVGRGEAEARVVEVETRMRAAEDAGDSALQEATDKAEEQRQELLTRISDLETASRATEEEEGRIREELQAAKVELEAKQQECETVGAKLQEVEGELGEVRGEYERERRASQEMGGQAEAVLREQQALTLAAEEQAQSFQSEWEAAVRELEDARREHAERLEQQNAQLEQARFDKVALETEVDQLRSDTSALKTELSEAAEYRQRMTEEHEREGEVWRARETELEVNLKESVERVAALEDQVLEVERQVEEADGHARVAGDLCKVAKEELESRNTILHQSLSTIIDQKSEIERMSLQLLAREVDQYVPQEAPPLPMEVVIAEAQLASHLKLDPAQLTGTSAKQEKVNSRSLLEQYAELHSYQALRTSVLNRTERVEKHLEGKIAELTKKLKEIKQDEVGERVKVEDELGQVRESLQRLRDKTKLWRQYEQEQKSGGGEAPVGGSRPRMNSVKMILAQAKANPGGLNPDNEEPPATPPIPMQDQQLKTLLENLRQVKGKTALAAARELVAVTAPRTDSDMRDRVAAHGGVEVVVEVLRSEHSSPLMQGMVCQLAAQLCRSEDHRQALGSAGLIPLLQDLLNGQRDLGGKDPHALQAGVCSALVEMSRDSPEVRSELVDAGCAGQACRLTGDGAIVLLSSEAVHQAITLLRQLLHSKDPLKTKEAAGQCPESCVVPLVRLLGARAGSEFGDGAERTAQMAVNIAWVLSSLTANSPPHRDKLGREGGVPVMVDLLGSTCAGDLPLGAAVVSALANTVTGHPENAARVIAARGVGPLLRVLLEPSGLGKSLSTRQSAAKALRALTQLMYSDEQRKIIQVLEKALPSCGPDQHHVIWTRVRRRAKDQIEEIVAK